MHQWSIFKIFLLYVTGCVNPAASVFSNNVICFVKSGGSVTVCNTTLSLCDTGVVTQISTDIIYFDSQAATKCPSPCTIPSNATANRSDILNHCYGTKVCTVNSTKISQIQGGALVFDVTCGATNPSSTVSNANSSGPNASSPGPNTSSTGPTASSTGPNTSSSSSTGSNASNTGPNASSSTGPTASSTGPNASSSSTGPNTSSTGPNASSSSTGPTASSTGPNASSSSTEPNTSSTGPNASSSSTGPTASSTGPNASSSSTGSNTSSTGPNASSTGPNTSSTVPNASSTGPDADSTTAASLNSDDPFPAAIAVSVVVSVIIVVLVVAFLMYRRGQCKQLLGKCTKGQRKHSPDRNDELVMGSMANANLTYDLSSVVDVNNYNEDYSEIDKVDKENYFEYSQVNVERKQPVQRLTYNHIGHFNKSSEDTEHIYNHVGDETSQKSSTLQPDTYSHVGAMARSESGHLAEDSYAHINGVVKDLPAAYETNHYDCAVFQFNGGQTGNSGHRGNEIKSGKENKFIVVGPSKVDMNIDDSVSHSYFVLEKHEKEA